MGHRGWVWRKIGAGDGEKWGKWGEMGRNGGGVNGGHWG